MSQLPWNKWSLRSYLGSSDLVLRHLHWVKYLGPWVLVCWTTLPCLREPTTCPCPWARWMQSVLSHLFFKSSLILFSHLCLGLSNGFFQISPPKPLYAFLPHIYRMPHPSCLHYLLQQYLVRNTNHQASHYAVSSYFLLLGPYII